MWINGFPNPPAIVSQAQGFVSVQAACTIPEALILMQARADVSRVGLEDIAEAVVDLSIRFGD